MAADRGAGRALAPAPGSTLRERLTIYPEYVRAWLAGAPWVDPRIAPHVRALADPETGLARPGAPSRRPAVAGAGRRPGATAAGPICTRASTTTGRTERPSRRLRHGLRRLGRRSRSTPRRTALPRLRPGRGWTSDVSATRCGWPSADPARCSMPRTRAQAMALFEADGAALDALVRIADDLRRDTVGDDVTYVVNRNINFTNVCYVGCRFCAFAQRERDADAYRLSVDQVADRAEQAWRDGASEVCMQGGIDPSLPSTAYADLVRAVKKRVPGIHVHAFSPMEIVTGAAKAGVAVREFLTELRDAGLDTIPGTAAEILDDDVRWVLTKGKLPAAAWVDVVSTAHSLGIRSSSTMMYGHVDHPRQWLDALPGAGRDPGPHRRLHRVRRAAVRAPQRPDLPGRHRPARADLAGEPGRARDGPGAAARAYRQYPVLLGQARRRGHDRHARRRLQRPGRHADGGDHLPDGRLRARLRPDGGRAAGAGHGGRPARRGNAPRRTPRGSRPSASYRGGHGRSIRRAPPSSSAAVGCSAATRWACWLRCRMPVSDPISSSARRSGPSTASSSRPTPTARPSGWRRSGAPTWCAPPSAARSSAGWARLARSGTHLHSNLPLRRLLEEHLPERQLRRS